MFVDASAIAAILLEEEDGEELANRIDAAGSCMTSPLAVFEASVAIARRKDGNVGLARSAVIDLIRGASIRIEPVNADTADLSLDAFARYGRGRHPARLNFGDCFAYAMAKQHGVPLLYKGDDFAHTDLA